MWTAILLTCLGLCQVPQPATQRFEAKVITYSEGRGVVRVHWQGIDTEQDLFFPNIKIFRDGEEVRMYQMPAMPYRAVVLWDNLNNIALELRYDSWR